jgi:hypothetical protein
MSASANFRKIDERFCIDGRMEEPNVAFLTQNCKSVVFLEPCHESNPGYITLLKLKELPVTCYLLFVACVCAICCVPKRFRGF